MYFHNKKGQVTIFIIIAVIVVAGVGLFFVFNDNIRNNLFASGADRINVFVEECIEDVGSEAVFGIGNRGGYFVPVNLSTKLGTPYYFSDNKSYMPSKEKVAYGISEYVNERLSFCVNDFEDFSDLEINSGEVNTETEINEDNVILNVDYPLTIIQGEDESQIDSFNVKVDVRMGLVYDAIQQFVSEHTNTIDICLTCLYNLMVEEDLFVEMTTIENGNVIFVVRDENSEINGEYFEYAFAMNRSV